MSVPRRFALLPLFALAMAMVGCGSANLDKTKVQKPLTDVVLRHDKYVEADPSLASADKAQAKVESASVRLAVESAPADGLDPRRIDATFQMIAARHDIYVASDPVASPLERRIWIRDTALIRRAIDASLNRATVPPVPPLPR